MQTTALEEKIKQLSADYIYEQAVGSLLLMLMSAMEDVEKGDAPLPYTIHEDLLAIKKDIRSYLLSLEDLLEGEQENRAAALEACMAKKEELLSIYETVYSYFSQWNLYSTLVSDQVALRKYKEEGIEVEKNRLVFVLCGLPRFYGKRQQPAGTEKLHGPDFEMPAFAYGA
ncbi:MAG: hypothetical protein V8Q36_05045 [Anaerotignum sp.]